MNLNSLNILGDSTSKYHFSIRISSFSLIFIREFFVFLILVYYVFQLFTIYAFLPFCKIDNREKESMGIRTLYGFDPRVLHCLHYNLIGALALSDLWDRKWYMGDINLKHELRELISWNLSSHLSQIKFLASLPGIAISETPDFY